MYSIDSSIIGISILGIVVPQLSGNFFGPSHPNNRGPPVQSNSLYKTFSTYASKIIRHYYLLILVMRVFPSPNMCITRGPLYIRGRTQTMQPFFGDFLTPPPPCRQMQKLFLTLNFLYTSECAEQNQYFFQTFQKNWSCK